MILEKLDDFEKRSPRPQPALFLPLGFILRSQHVAFLAAAL
jgi:hypothetical protein